MLLVPGVARRVGLSFRCDYGVHRRCGVGGWLVQHLSGDKWARHSPHAVIAQTVTAGATAQRHLVAAKEASPAKDVSAVVARADTKKSKHHKPKMLARQPGNYRYGNALGYAQESGYSARGLFFR